MGTSKRNISNKVKKILENKSFHDLNSTAPELSKKILTKREINKQLIDEKDIIDSFNIISSKFKSLSLGGYKGKSKQDIIVDTITQEEFINMILDAIDNDEFLNKSILEKAYKIAMTMCLQQEEFDVYTFAQLLFYHLVHQILLKDLHDTLKDLYTDLSYNEIDNLISNLTNQIVNDAVYPIVVNFVDRKVPMKMVLDRIIFETKNASFGEF